GGGGCRRCWSAGTPDGAGWGGARGAAGAGPAGRGGGLPRGCRVAGGGGHGLVGRRHRGIGVGAVAAHEGVAGIALGSVIGAAMVAIALALGVTAPLVPLRFGHASASVLSVPILAVLLFGGLSLDGDRQPGDGAGGALAKSNASVSPSVLPAERRHHRAGQAVPGRTAGARVSFSRGAR